MERTRALSNWEPVPGNRDQIATLRKCGVAET